MANVLPFLNSMMPAMTCASPPTNNPSPRIVGSILMMPALWMFSITVVRPKQVNPSTAGFANLMSSVIPRPPPSPSPVSSLADLLVHQLLRARDQLVYHTGLGQGAGVAQG